MMKIKLTILSPRYNIPPLPFSLSFPTVVLLKLLQYRPADLRWATIVVVMQLTVIKAKIKGVESSSQLRWFTIAKIELYYYYLFVSDSTNVHNNAKNKNTQTNLSGTTQSINMRANLAKM